MPSTYEPIATNTLSSTASSITFSSIPGTYTDLVLICNLKATPTASSLVARFNGSSSNIYSVTQMYGTGSTAFSQRLSNQTEVYLSFSGFPAGNFGPTIVNFINYSNTTTNKTFISRSGYATDYADASVGLWRSTAAISSMTLFAGTSFDIGSIFTLYGIKAA